MVTNRQINFSGSYIICGKKSSSLTYFGKRTTLNSKNIGLKFCFRSMMTGRKVVFQKTTSSLRCNIGQVKRTQLAIEPKFTTKRTFVSQRIEELESEYIELRKVRHKKKDPSSDHFVIQQPKENKERLHSLIQRWRLMIKNKIMQFFRGKIFTGKRTRTRKALCNGGFIGNKN